jgi:hypothetical protein
LEHRTSALLTPSNFQATRRSSKRLKTPEQIPLRDAKILEDRGETATKQGKDPQNTYHYRDKDHNGSRNKVSLVHPSKKKRQKQTVV